MILPNKFSLLEKAKRNVSDILLSAIEHDTFHTALVVYDTENELTELLTEAYRSVLKTAIFVDFNTKTKEEIIALFNTLSPSDLVVLIQSSDFRLNEFRIRIQLFERKLKVIDHQHLYRNSQDSWETYIDSLAYDKEWYRGTGHRLKNILEHTNTLDVYCENTKLTITDGLEIPKPNIGDYAGMKNVGGTFPIGEVFTEAKDLTSVNGSLMIYAFADTTFNIQMHDPFKVTIHDGMVISWDAHAPASFPLIIESIRAHERPILREIGFGLNRAITRKRHLNDITAFERSLGLHFSIGEKHTVYKKQGITPDKTRFHVDVFPLVTKVCADGVPIFQDEAYCL